MRVVDPAVNRQHTRVVDGADVVGAKPARLGERIRVRPDCGTPSPASRRRAPPARRRSRAPAPRPAATPSYTQPPAVSLIPYVRTTETPAAEALSATPAGIGPPPISTASSDGQRRGRAGSRNALSSCAATSDAYRRPEPSDVDGRGAVRRRRNSRRLATGVVPATHAAHQHLQAGDVMGGQRQQPSCPGRRGGRGWPRRWRSTPPRSASRPSACPSCPTSTPRRRRRRRSSSPGAQRRCQQRCLACVVGRHRQNAAGPASTSANSG